MSDSTRMNLLDKKYIANFIVVIFLFLALLSLGSSLTCVRPIKAKTNKTIAKTTAYPESITKPLRFPTKKTPCQCRRCPSPNSAQSKKTSFLPIEKYKIQRFVSDRYFDLFTITQSAAAPHRDVGWRGINHTLTFLRTIKLRC